MIIERQLRAVQLTLPRDTELIIHIQQEAEGPTNAAQLALNKFKGFVTRHVTQLSRIGLGETEDHKDDFTTDHAPEIEEQITSLVDADVKKPDIQEALAPIFRRAHPTGDKEVAGIISDGLCETLIFPLMDNELGRRELSQRLRPPTST